MKRLHPITKGVLGLIEFRDGSLIPSCFIPLKNHNENVSVDKKNDKVSMGILELENVGDQQIPKIFLPSLKTVKTDDEPYVFKYDPSLMKIFPNFFN